MALMLADRHAVNVILWYYMTVLSCNAVYYVVVNPRYGTAS
jgi:hypothetical protein